MVACPSAAIVLALTLQVASPAVSPEPTDPAGRDETSVRLNDLPKPPPELVALIKSADVSFVTDGQPMMDQRDLPAGLRIAGETRFKSRYRYNSKARWQRVGNKVEIRVSFRSLKLIQKHVIWLKNVPEAKDFWSDRIVLHEFDHVRISADERIEAKFREDVQRLSRFLVPTREVFSNGRVDNTKVQRAIRVRVEEVYQRLTDYVGIRYQELDRVTKHGLLPLPSAATVPVETSEID